jgi:hypothetical protein
MDSQQQLDQKCGQQEESTRSEHDALNMLKAFENGEYSDCIIRVGCDLKDSNSSFKVCKCKVALK